MLKYRSLSSIYLYQFPFPSFSNILQMKLSWQGGEDSDDDDDDEEKKQRRHHRKHYDD